MQLKKIYAFFVLIFVVIFALPFHLNLTEAAGPAVPFGKPISLPNDEKEILWLARAINSETKNREEQIMIAWVIRNRVESGYRGTTYKEVVLAPNQFSGLQAGDPQFKINISRDLESGGSSWRQALDVARAVYYAPAALRPIPESVRHFYSPHAVPEPEWAAGERAVYVIRDPNLNHTRFAFYDGVK